MARKVDQTLQISELLTPDELVRLMTSVEDSAGEEQTQERIRDPATASHKLPCSSRAPPADGSVAFLSAGWAVSAHI